MTISVSLVSNQLRASTGGLNREVIVIGHATSGTAATAARFTSVAALTAAYGNGEGVEAAAQAIQENGVVRFARATSTPPSAPTLTLSGTSPTITVTGNPHDSYRIKITVIDGGTLGTATLKFSFDAGSNDEYGTYATAASITDFASETGLTFACASGTYVAGDTYTVTCGRPVITGANYGLALDAALAIPGDYRNILYVGIAASLANQLTTIGTCNTKLAGLGTSSIKFVGGFFECTTDSDATVTSAISSTTAANSVLCLGHQYGPSVITGREMLRSQAWSIALRAARVPSQERIARVASGPIETQITSLTRDDRITPNAKGMRCAALKTLEFNGVSAVYGGPCYTLASPISDFSEYVRAAVAWDAANLFLSLAARWENEGQLLLDADGSLTAEQAKVISDDISAKMRAEMRPIANGRPGPTAAVADVYAVVDDTSEFKNSETLRGTIYLVPFGYVSAISFQVGYTLQAQ